MAAVQVLASASTTIVAAANHERSGVLVNNGPNTIWVSSDGAATVTGSVPVAAGASLAFFLRQGEALAGIASTADQASPADTRVETSGVPG